MLHKSDPPSPISVMPTLKIKISHPALLGKFMVMPAKEGTTVADVADLVIPLERHLEQMLPSPNAVPVREPTLTQEPSEVLPPA